MKLGEREKEEMREEHCNFVKTLTYLGINVIEIAASRTESLQQSSQFTNMIGDLVFIINGVALFLQPHDRMREKEVILRF
ncbi:MAG: N(G),N(G)-dimethylarginine dimethylaminohydrolase 1 [Marteilia pararefringens]